MATGPKILVPRLVARSRLIHVEEVDLEFTNGARRTFERIPGGADSVLIVPLLDAHTLPLIREYGAGSERYELGLPKGIVEPGEGPVAAANRELQEEVGCAARDLQVLGRVFIVPGYIGHCSLIALARALYPSRLLGDEPEPIEVVPWRLDALDALLARDDFDEARSLAALYLTDLPNRATPGAGTRRRPAGLSGPDPCGHLRPLAVQGSTVNVRP